MDSSNNPQSGPSTSLRSNLKRKAKTVAMDKLKSKKAKFIDTYIHQRFSLPPSIMLYIAKNPSTPEVYQRLIESCKYFFVKNQILVISRLLHYGDHSRVNNKRKPFDLTKSGCKYWITDELYVGPKDWKSDIAVDQNIVSAIIPKLYRCDAEQVNLFNQNISCHDLTFLISSAEYIFFKNVTIKNDDGTNVAVEEIVEVAFKSKFTVLENPTVTSKTMKELIKIPHFAKLDEFVMADLSEKFDLEAFYGYMKKNKLTKFVLFFDDSISDAYKNRLEKIVDEIFATGTREYKTPCISFDGLDEKKCDQLFAVYEFS